MAKPKFKRDETVTVPSVGVGTVKVVMRINNGWVYKVEFRGGYQEEFAECKLERRQGELFDVARHERLHAQFRQMPNTPPTINTVHPPGCNCGVCELVRNS